MYFTFLINDFSQIKVGKSGKYVGMVTGNWLQRLDLEREH